jgi:hypothetical protein
MLAEFGGRNVRSVAKGIGAYYEMQRNGLDVGFSRIRLF